MRGPVQMRIDGDQGIEMPGEHCPDDTLADGLSQVERDILSHVAKIRRNERHSLRAETRGCRCGEFEFDQSAIGIIEARIEDDSSRKLLRQPREAPAEHDRGVSDCAHDSRVNPLSCPTASLEDSTYKRPYVSSAMRPGGLTPGE
jgi:hypothetical protein